MTLSKILYLSALSLFVVLLFTMAIEIMYGGGIDCISYAQFAGAGILAVIMGMYPPTAWGQ